MLNIEALSVSAFRGIPGELTLSFDAALTVICAPNGTGKTTVCDAIEWLLTDRVQRLDSAASNEGNTSWRCHFAKSDTSTFVKGQVVCDGTRRLLTRTLDPAQLLMADFGDEPQVCPPGQLLDWLCSHAAPDSLRPVARIARQRNWLSSTHLLSGERLAVLLDTDPRSHQARQELFADLLGVGELARTLTRVDKVSKELQRVAVREREALGDADTALETLATQLQQAGVRPDLGLARSAINDVVAILRMPDATATEADDQDQLGVTVGRLREALNSRNLTLEEAAPLWHTVEAWITFDAAQGPLVESARVEMPSLRKQEAELREGIAILQRDIASLTAGDSGRRDQLAHLTLTLAELDTAMPILEQFASLEALSSATVSQVVAAIERLPLAEAAAAHTASLRALDGASRFAELQATLAAAQDQLATMPAEELLREEMLTQKGQVEAALRLRTELEAERAALASLDEQMVAIGREIAGRTTTPDCPLCGHDWGSANALLAAMDRVSTLLGPRATTLAAKSDQATRALKQAESALATVTTRYRRRQQLEADTTRCREEIRQHRVTVAASGCSDADLIDATKLAAVIERAKCRWSAAQLIGRLRTAVPDFVANGEDSEWRETARLYADKRRSQIAELQSAASKADADREAKRKTLQTRQEALAALSARIASLESLLSEATDMTQRGEAAASVLSLGPKLSAGAVKQARADWVVRREEIKQAEARLLVASNVLVISQQAQQIAELNRKRDHSMARVTLVTERADQLRELRTFLDESLTRTKGERLSAARQSVQSLFLRMHANQLFEFVQPTADASGFAAKVQNMFFDAVDLSQGQRQDLALAIFLSRARMYGGTFFLDEPLLHLDDLNRVALLDVLRALALQEGQRLRIVMTTASSQVLAHLQQKFATVVKSGESPLLRAYRLSGTPKEGVSVEQVT